VSGFYIPYSGTRKVACGINRHFFEEIEAIVIGTAISFRNTEYISAQDGRLGSRTDAFG